MFSLFQPPAVKAVLAAMAALEFGEHQGVVAQYLPAAKDIVRKQPKRTAFTLEKFKNPSGVALLVLLDEIGNDVASGRLHVYRGMLGTGGGFVTAAYADVVRQLRECRTLSEEEANQAMDSLRDAIRAAG